VCCLTQNIDYDKRQRLQELAKAKKRLSKVEVIMKRQIIQNQPEQVCLTFLSVRACSWLERRDPIDSTGLRLALCSRRPE
jgi:hypothetical protein